MHDIWNPWHGCVKCSEGCEHCYMYFLDRVRERYINRSFQKFGEKMLLGGDLHEQEEKFFDFVKSRSENTVEEWVKSLKCPVLRIDGRKAIEANVDFIMGKIKNRLYLSRK